MGGGLLRVCSHDRTPIIARRPGKQSEFQTQMACRSAAVRTCPSSHPQGKSQSGRHFATPCPAGTSHSRPHPCCSTQGCNSRSRKRYQSGNALRSAQRSVISRRGFNGTRDVTVRLRQRAKGVRERTWGRRGAPAAAAGLVGGGHRGGEEETCKNRNGETGSG